MSRQTTQSNNSDSSSLYLRSSFCSFYARRPAARFTMWCFSRITLISRRGGGDGRLSDISIIRGCLSLKIAEDNEQFCRNER